MMRETHSVGTVNSARAVRRYKRMYSGTMDCGRGFNFQHTPEHTKQMLVNSCESIYIHASPCPWESMQINANLYGSMQTQVNRNESMQTL